MRWRAGRGRMAGLEACDTADRMSALLKAWGLLEMGVGGVSGNGARALGKWTRDRDLRESQSAKEAKEAALVTLLLG